MVKKSQKSVKIGQSYNNKNNNNTAKTIMHVAGKNGI